MAWQDRLEWPDAAKGIGILLVVLGHVIGGLIDAPLPIGGWPLREVFFGIYVFHMPLFFLLSGLFVAQRIQVNRRGFARGLWRTLYYPYLLWSAVQFTVIYAAGASTNAPAGPYWTTILSIPYRPGSQFWFLLVLGVMHLLTLFLLPRVGGRGVVAAALVLHSIADIAQPHAILVQGTLDFYLFYALGLALGPAGVEKVVCGPQSARAAIGTVLALALLVESSQVMIVRAGLPIFYREAPRLGAALIADIAWGATGIGAALAMTAAVIVWAERATGGIKRILVHLGRKSMPIYILHVMFAAGTRIVMVRLAHVTDVTILLPLLLVAGIAGPLVTQTLLLRWRLARALGLA